MTESSSATIQVAFPKADTGSSNLVVPPKPAPVVETGLVAYANQPAQVRDKVLRCSDLLVGDTRTQAQAEAQKLYLEMVGDRTHTGNTQVFMAYGTAALKDVNDLVDRLLHDVEPIKVPELQAIMRELNKEMHGIKGKYDVSDPKVREKYEHWKGGVGRFIGRARSLIDMLMEDVTSLETQLNKVGKDLGNRQYQLMRNVTYYDELYEQNEQEILKVIYAIAVMELILECNQRAMQAIVVGDANAGDRQGEYKRRLAEFQTNMQVKITEYKGRLMVAWATSPQVDMMRTLNVGLAERINELLCVTIPTMKATIVQWRMLIETQQAAQLSQAVQEASNEWLQAYAAAGAEVVPMIAEAVQTPTLTPQTVAAMADSIQKQADGILRAWELGEQKRQALDSAIIDAKRVLDSTSQRFSETIVDSVLTKARQALEISQSVPAA